MTHMPHFPFILFWTVEKQHFVGKQVDKTASSINRLKNKLKKEVQLLVHCLICLFMRFVSSKVEKCGLTIIAWLLLSLFYCALQSLVYIEI